MDLIKLFYENYTCTTRKSDITEEKRIVKQSMAEEDTVGDEDDGIMSEDTAEEKEGPQALNTTSRIRY